MLGPGHTPMKITFQKKLLGDTTFYWVQRRWEDVPDDRVLREHEVGMCRRHVEDYFGACEEDDEFTLEISLTEQPDWLEVNAHGNPGDLMLDGGSVDASGALIQLFNENVKFGRSCWVRRDPTELKNAKEEKATIG